MESHEDNHKHTQQLRVIIYNNVFIWIILCYTHLSQSVYRNADLQEDFKVNDSDAVSHKISFQGNIYV